MSNLHNDIIFDQIKDMSEEMGVDPKQLLAEYDAKYDAMKEIDDTEPNGIPFDAGDAYEEYKNSEVKGMQND